MRDPFLYTLHLKVCFVGRLQLLLCSIPVKYNSLFDLNPLLMISPHKKPKRPIAHAAVNSTQLWQPKLIFQYMLKTLNNTKNTIVGQF